MSPSDVTFSTMTAPTTSKPFQEEAGTKRSMEEFDPSNNKKPRPLDASSMLLVDLPFDMLMELYGSVPFPQLLRHRAACKKFSQQILLLAAVRIELKHYGIKAEGAASLAVALPQCAALQHLNLGYNNIGDEGAASLAGALPQCASLQHLDLLDNDIGSEGAASLAVVLPQCASLQHLDLRGNKIRDDGAASLLAVAPECLKELNIRYDDL